jgi:hypothetical protein
LLTLKAVFSLPYRFARSLMSVMGLELNIPNHSHLSRRAKTLSVVIPRRVHNEPLYVVIDSTGLKVYGEACLELVE